MRTKIFRFICLLALLMLIMDSRTAVLSVQEGLKLCVDSVIPSIFPFVFLITLSSPILFNSRFIRGSWFSRLLHIPNGSEIIFLIGLLGGYPTGAQNLNWAVRNGNLSSNDGKRMMAFCSNAGPAFIFGMGTHILGKASYCWFAWGLQIVSAIIVALITPGVAQEGYSHDPSTPHISVRKSIQETWRTLSQISGWIILMRIVIGFLDKYLFRRLSAPEKVLLCGILELSNGICRIPTVSNLGLRFCLFNVFLTFGGLCVAGQTKSVCDCVSMRMYLPGKVAQVSITVLLSLICQHFLPKDDRFFLSFPIILCATILPIIYFLYAQKTRNYTSNQTCFAV